MLATIALALAVAQPVQAARADALEARFNAVDAVARTGDFKTATAMAKTLDDEAVRDHPRDAARRYRTLRFYRAMLVRVDPAASARLMEPLVALVDTNFPANDSRRLQVHYDRASGAYSRRDSGASLAAVEATVLPLADVADTESERLNAGQALASLATELAIAGDVARARPLAARAIALADAVPTPGQRKGRIYGFVARFEDMAGNPRGGIALCERAIAVFEADQGEGHHNIPPTLGNAAFFALKLGDFSAAEAYLRRAIRLVDAKPGLPGDVRVRAMQDYGKFLADTRRYDLAFPLLERAAVTANAEFKGRHPLKESVAIIAGTAYLDAGRPADAGRHFAQGVALLSLPSASARARGLMRINLARAEIADRRVDAAATTLALASGDLAPLPADDAARLSLAAMLAEITAIRGDTASAIAQYEATIAKFDPGQPSPLRDSLAIQAGVQREKLGRVDRAAWARSRKAADNLIATSVGIATLSDAAREQGRVVALLDGSLDVAWAAAKRR